MAVATKPNAPDGDFAARLRSQSAIQNGEEKGVGESEDSSCCPGVGRFPITADWKTHQAPPMEHCCTKTAQGYEECQGNEVPFAKAKISRAHKHVNAQVQQETAQGAAEKLRYEALERDPNHQCLRE